MRKTKVNKEKILLVTIILVAAILRFVGTKPGFHQFHCDESTIYSAAVTFLKNRSFEPVHYEYPALENYLNYFFFKFIFIPLGWLNFLVLNSSQILDGIIKFPLGKDIYNKVWQLEILGSRDLNALFWARWVTALFGVGVVWASYLVGKKLFGKWTGLLSALLVSVNYRQVLNSHFGLPDIYNAFFFLLAFWAVLRLREKINLGRALVCGTLIGFFFSTKYQFFPLVALFLVYLELALKRDGLKEKVSFLFNPYFFLIPLASLLVFILLNPYLFINLGTAISQLSYAALKNGAGSMKLMYYPYSYLFKIGIGRVTSFIIIAGILFGLFREKWKSTLLLSVIIPFFFFFTFYSIGGFYTRNFISITPFLLIFAAYAIWKLASIKPRAIFLSLALVILSAAVWENLANSLVVLKEYTQPWNADLTAAWIEKEIPKGSVIAAHSSVPVPDDRVRIPYDRWPWPYFSLAEFQAAGADYAIASLDWISIDYYGWMGPSKYWDKPVAEMRQTYAALTMDELTDFGLHQDVNPWQAPDSNFVVAKVPYYSLISREKSKIYQLDDTQPVSEWRSEPIEVGGWSGFDIEYQMKMEVQRPDYKDKDYKDGMIYLKFYSNLEEALKGENHMTVRLSARDDKPEVWINEELIGKIPHGAHYAVLGFQTYDPIAAKYYLGKIELYKAEVTEDLGGKEVMKIKIDENVLFPNSHGNL